MSEQNTNLSQSSDERALRECLELVIANQFGIKSSIRQISRQRSSFTTSYPCDIITVRLASGKQIKVFLKDFRFSYLPKNGIGERRDRELRVYQELLAEADLGTASYYGSVWDESQGRFWLLLEYVEGKPVSYREFEHWVEAARWLGRMHGYFAERIDSVRSRDFLMQHDTAYFVSTAEAALRSIIRISPELAKRLAPIVSRYAEVVDVMVSHPKTFVHGAYRPKQIVLDTSCAPPRYCPVDWELAAIGSGFFDLAFIADGFTAPRLDQVLDAYRAGAAGTAMHIPSNRALRFIVDCYRLHRVMNWLSKAADRQYPDQVVSKLLRLAYEVSCAVL